MLPHPFSTYLIEPGDPDGKCSQGGGVAVNGVIYPLSAVRHKQITDGSTQTMIVGEFAWAVGPQRTWIVGSAAKTRPNHWNYTSKNVMHPLKTAFREATGEPSSGYSNNDVSIGSEHPGGAHVAMADASVQFLREDVDLNGVLRPLASRESDETFQWPL